MLIILLTVSLLACHHEQPIIANANNPNEESQECAGIAMQMNKQPVQNVFNKDTIMKHAELLNAYKKHQCEYPPTENNGNGN